MIGSVVRRSSDALDTNSSSSNLRGSFRSTTMVCTTVSHRDNLNPMR